MGSPRSLQVLLPCLLVAVVTCVLLWFAYIVFHNSERKTTLLCRFDVRVKVNGQETMQQYHEPRINDTSDSFITENNKSVAWRTEDEGTIKSSNHSHVLVGLEDIKRSAKNIFFVESRCFMPRLAMSTNLRLSARQSCSVESAARTNPGRDVYIVHTCPISDDFLSTAPEYVKTLLRLRNVHVVRFTLEQLFLHSPVWELYQSGRMRTSLYPVSHASDVIRMLLLWRYGGTYCDLDVVLIRSLDPLGTNFAGFEDSVYIGSAVLNFEPFGLGHEFSARILHYLNRHFNGRHWSSNGPSALTKLIKSFCQILADREGKPGEFTVFHPDVLYPVYYEQYLLLFSANSSKSLVEYIKTTAFCVHMWNNISKNETVQVGSDQPYALLAQEFCPCVTKTCGPTF